MPTEDSDLKWLLDYVPASDAPPLQRERVEKLRTVLESLIARNRLPFTIGLFGGWGTGKTTFLSILASDILHNSKHKVIYFNAWKYAGFLEIIPSLIYKILKFGNHSSKDPAKAITEIMVSLGTRYSESLGQWAERLIGIDPAEIFKRASEIYSTIKQGATPVPKDIMDAYYTQLDRAQDQLAGVFSDRKKVTIVLIDELDRCDPDEAFTVIKQLRVFFAMRDLPIAFIVCANPEPIGLAIKHKYGLSTVSGDYEARRILEKFVDVYIDMGEPVELDEFVRWLWLDVKRKIEDYAFVARIDSDYTRADPNQDTIRNVTALQAIKTDNPLYGNLRLLRKTLERVCTRSFPNQDMLWTAWHLEIAAQMDPEFRRNINAVAGDIEDVSVEAHKVVLTTPLSWEGKILRLESNPGGTVFGAYRSAFWDVCKTHHLELQKISTPQGQERARILAHLLSDPRRMDFVAIMALAPGDAKKDLKGVMGMSNFEGYFATIEAQRHQLGYLLASY